MEVDNLSDSEGEVARLIHFDLKGAPPKIQYYEQLFPLLRRWGATGILIEYEDMFPYEGDLQDIAASHAYSKEEISRILTLAEENELDVIPLVQTFAHFEFVLKHDKFKHLREVPNYPMTLCPQNEEALPLVMSMVDQVMALHPDVKAFHIGADEAFHMGFCNDCKKHMSKHNVSEINLFLDHVKQVLEQIREKYPHLTLIMWDDMFRNTEVQTIFDSGIGCLVEPMIWYYQRSFHLPEDIWDRYSKVFSNFWAASAFKGATGPCMFVTDIGYHIENHKGWLVQLQEHSNKFKRFKGCCITGWQRYDHYAIMCELLPTAMPSLALCLLTLTNGAFTAEVHKVASVDLQFADLIPLSPFQQIGMMPQCDFPGSDIYLGCLILLQLQEEYENFTRSDRLHGWFTDFHRKHNFTNPAHINNFLPQGLKLLDDLNRLKVMLKTSLNAIFPTVTTEEWICVRLDPLIEKMEKLVEDSKKQVTLGGGDREEPTAVPNNE